MANSFRNFLNAWEDFRVAANDYRELDNERVLVLVQASGRGKTSGVELGQMRTKGAHVFQVRNGKVTRLIQYPDADRALADLGLAPEGGPA